MGELFPGLREAQSDNDSFKGNEVTFESFPEREL
jgi:hypothetical protein